MMIVLCESCMIYLCERIMRMHHMNASHIYGDPGGGKTLNNTSCLVMSRINESRYIEE